MTAVLLDSSVVIAFLRGNAAAVAAVQRCGGLVVTPVVEGEVRLGFRASPRPQEERLFAELLSSPRITRTAIDAETAVRWVTIVDALRRAGTPVPANDSWIAASAMQHGLRVLTTDPHFERIPQILVERIEPA